MKSTLIAVATLRRERRFSSDCFIGGRLGYRIAFTFLLHFDRDAPR